MDKGDLQWLGKTLFASKGELVSNLKNWWTPDDIPGPGFKAPPDVNAFFYKRLFFVDAT